MIKVENVSFKYKNSDKMILDNLNMEIKDGETIAIVGQNGSGKSTLGKILSGIVKTKRGKVTIDDIEISDKKFHDKVGIVFQNPENQIIFNNIFDEISFSLKGLEKSEIEKRINDSLKQVGMLDYKDNDLYTLSLGQKQRIMIAEVLAKRPKYIILDEPTTMIDSMGKESIYKILVDLKKEGYTIICITNLADEILIADRTLILKDGKIASEIMKKDLIDKVQLLEENGIKVPVLLEILDKLKKKGIEINLEDYTINELVEKIKEGITKYEKRS